MAQYPKITITNAGLNMIAESQGGTSIIFTKMVMGDGLLADGENIKVMTNVKNAMLAVPLQGFTNQNDGQIRLRFTVSNSNLETGFFAREIGVFAKMGATGAEQLYAYTNAGNKSDYLPDKSVPLDSQILDLYLVVGNATNISAVLDGNASYATKLDMTEHDSSETAHSVIINNLKTKIESAGINLRKNSKTYVVGDVAYSLTLPTWARLDCIQGGTTASTEPTWGTVMAGQVFTDGTVVWVVCDVKGGFTIIYPNGGTKASPANITNNSRYVLSNPFPGYQVYCICEVLYNGQWGETGTYTDFNGAYYCRFAKATQLGDNIVLQTGNSGIMTVSAYSCNPFNITDATTGINITTLPCRIKVFKLGGTA